MPSKDKVEEYLSKSDEDLVVIVGDNTRDLAPEAMAKAVLQIHLGDKIKNLDLSIKENTRVLNQFKENTADYNAKTSRQTSIMIFLTIVIIALTLVMLFGLSVQIWLIWPK